MTNLNNAIDLTDVPQSEWREKYIGDGYRHCSYTTVRDEDFHNPSGRPLDWRIGEGQTGRIILFGYDKNNNPQTFICPWKCHIAYNVGYKTKKRDIFGRYVDYKYFATSKARKSYIEKSEGLNVVECLKPEQEFLHYMFDDVALNDNFNCNKLRTFFLDIETEMGEKFEYPKTARQRINMITIYDTKTMKYYTWSLGYATTDFTEEPLCSMNRNMFELRIFNNNEKRMLLDFINWWENNEFDVVNAYNGQAFDIPYIVNRIERVLGNPDTIDNQEYKYSNITKRLSPVGRISTRETNMDNMRANKSAEITTDIKGIFVADELVLYRDKFAVKNPLDGGYSLDNVGEAEGLGHKIHYESTLKELYENNFQKFYEYNVRDVDLLRRIEEKCHLIESSVSMASAGLEDFNKIYSSIAYITGSVIQFANKELGLVFPSYINTKSEKNEKYEGAFVFPPIPNLYNDGIACFDVNSLYPNSTLATNISPETLVGKISRKPINNEDFVTYHDFLHESPIELNGKDSGISKFYMLTPKGEQKIVSRKKLDELLETKCIFSRNNTIYLKHSIKFGIIPRWCEYYYKMRKSTKKRMEAKEKELYDGKIPETEIESAKTTIQNLNVAQLSKKRMINSIYGMFGNQHSSIFSVWNAQSITRTGKFFNQSNARHVRDVFKKEFGSQYAFEKLEPWDSDDNDDFQNDKTTFCCSGDTDSQFVYIKPIVEDMRKKNNLPKKLFDWSDEWKLKLWNRVEDFVENDVNKYGQNLIRNTYHTEKAEVLRYSLEYIGDRAIYQAKKNYAVRKIVAEGPEIINKIKYCGIELKKGNLPIEVKKFLSDIYEGVLMHDWTENDYKKYILSAHEEFIKLGIQQMSWWKGYNTYRESDGFLHMKKLYSEDTGRSIGDTAISTACTYHNQLTEHLKIGDKYPDLLLGEKVRFAYIKPTNKYGIRYIAFHDDQYPKEFESIFELDVETMWDKMVVSALKNFRLATKFKNYNPNNQSIMDPDDL